ncbi:MAG: 1-acyl-sn-glycerol-3-phosphate acyltransferase [Candidatus Omnitrophica bacterium]|nr:1-acyl-sn-glycerol-3-phosphate acyltransferase [Candidatus Omnitrophota bacterium]
MKEVMSPVYKDFIVLNSGVKIFPQEIEEFYMKIAPVKEMCVFMVYGMQGVKKSKALWAIIQPNLDDFREFSEVNLRLVIKERLDNASQSLQLYKRLKGFTITMENLPHNQSGLLERSAVKRIYESRVIAGIEGALSVSKEMPLEDRLLIQSETGRKVLKCLRMESGMRRPIILEDSLELDLGIDSLGRIELASCLEIAFDAEITVETVAQAFSVKDLIVGITDTLRGVKDIPFEDQGLSLGPDYWKEHLQVLPKQENLEMLELGTGYFAWLFRFTLTAIDCLIFKGFFNIKVEGAENVPQEGAYILYGNHTSFLDGPAIGACLPRRPVFQIFYFVFGPYFFRPFEKNIVLRNLVKMGRFIPFDYSTHFLEALRSAYYVLQRGKGLCFFPEGLRSATGGIGEFRRGFGVLAKETGAKLVPVAIEGAHEAWSSTVKNPRCYPIRVKFGKPLLPEDLEKQGLAMGSEDNYDAICIAARQALVELKSGVSLLENNLEVVNEKHKGVRMKEKIVMAICFLCVGSVWTLAAADNMGPNVVNNSYQAANRNNVTGQSIMQTGTDTFRNNSNAAHDNHQSMLESSHSSYSTDSNFKHDSDLDAMKGDDNSDFLDYSNSRHDAEQDYSMGAAGSGYSQEE